MRVFQLLELPELLEADALYFILNGDYAESYLTDDNGVAKFIGNTSMIESLAAGGSTTVAELTDATTYDFPTLNTPVSDALAAKANSTDLGTISTFEGDQNLRTTDSPTFAGITIPFPSVADFTDTFSGNVRKCQISSAGVALRSDKMIRWSVNTSSSTADSGIGRGSIPASVAIGNSAVGDASGTVQCANLTASGTVEAAAYTLGGVAQQDVSTGASPTFAGQTLTATQTVAVSGTVPVIYQGGSQAFNQFKTGATTRGYMGWTSLGGGGMCFLNASGAAATLLVSDTGNLTASGTVTAGAVTVPLGGTLGAFTGGQYSGLVNYDGYDFLLKRGSSTTVRFAFERLFFPSPIGLCWSNQASVGSLGTADVGIARSGINTLEVNNGAKGNTSGSLSLANLTASGTVSAADGYFSESVGIGTTPAASLHVYSESSTIPVFIGRLPYKTNANSQLRQRGGFIVDVAEGGASMSFGGIGSTSGGYIQAYQTNSTGTSRPLVLNPFGGFVGIGFGYQQSPTEALDVVGNIKASGTVQTGSYTVATLPPTPSTGMRAQVTDSSVAPHGHFGTTVAAGGSNIVPVFYNGTNWIIA